MESSLSASFSKVYETPFATTYLDPNSKIMCHEYKAASGQMTEEEYKHELTMLQQHINQYGVKGLFSDTRLFFFIITPDLQQWTNENLLSKIPTVERIAVMVSPDLVTQLSVEQTIDEKQTEGILPIKFFIKVEKALSWLGYSLPPE
ncbi:MAG: hypothetical protein RMJ44_05165 [Cytophagales bacterium]|nr:hypothetical protein [Bernardetiaceae bacterium]MDW8210456.1 hypothetical protein [Cytophagales bacterium]